MCGGGGGREKIYSNSMNIVNDTSSDIHLHFSDNFSRRKRKTVPCLKYSTHVHECIAVVNPWHTTLIPYSKMLHGKHCIYGSYHTENLPS